MHEYFNKTSPRSISETLVTSTGTVRLEPVTTSAAFINIITMMKEADQFSVDDTSKIPAGKLVGKPDPRKARLDVIEKAFNFRDHIQSRGGI